jgi:hypothetical protein
MAQAGPWASFSSFAAITPSSSTTVNCRALYVGGTGTVVVAPKVGGTLVTFTAVPVGAILPIELDQGIVDASSTATFITALQ